MITLEHCRQHCRVDGDEDDYLLEQYRFAALETLKTHTSRQWYESADDIPADDATGIHYTAAANQAALLLVGHWYAHREIDPAVSDIPIAFWHLIQPYRIYGL